MVCCEIVSLQASFLGFDVLCSYAISHEKGRDVKKLTRSCVVNRSTSKNLCCKRCKTIPNLSSASAIFKHLTKIMTRAHDTKIIEMKSLLHAPVTKPYVKKWVAHGCMPFFGGYFLTITKSKQSNTEAHYVGTISIGV